MRSTAFSIHSFAPASLMSPCRTFPENIEFQTLTFCSSHLVQTSSTRLEGSLILPPSSPVPAASIVPSIKSRAGVCGQQLRGTQRNNVVCEDSHCGVREEDDEEMDTGKHQSEAPPPLRMRNTLAIMQLASSWYRILKNRLSERRRLRERHFSTIATFASDRRVWLC